MKIKMFTIPNMITLLNLFCGCIASFFAFRGDLQFSLAFILIAAILDFLDGFAARLLNAYSPLGKQLDSLADVISFGFAPSAILLEVFQCSGGTGVWGWSMFMIAAFSALRLAKFNIDESQTEEFTGLPTPACAIFIASSGYIVVSGNFYLPSPWILVAIAFGLSALLISPIRMFSLKFHTWGLRENVLRYSFILVSLAALLLLQITAIPLVVLSYVLISTVRHLRAMR